MLSFEISGKSSDLMFESSNIWLEMFDKMQSCEIIKSLRWIQKKKKSRKFKYFVY